MNNTNETQGVRVLDISPGQRANRVNVNSNIVITFSADINPASFAKNIVVLEDHNKIYKNVNSLKDYSQFNVVSGSISYKDRVLTYTPNKAFNTDSCYIVMLNSGIKDITGNVMMKKHVSCFFTESVASYPRVEIIAPKYGTISDKFPEFIWKNQYSPSYSFQISRSNDFELLLYDQEIPGNHVEELIKHTPGFDAEEGMYHIRIKSDGGEWSDTHQVFVKPVMDAVVSKEDVPEMIHLDDFLDGLEDPVEVLEMFPPKDSVNISLKTNIVYIKIKGKVDEDDIKWDECYVYGENFDETDSESTAHEVVDGKWTVVYDSYWNVSYIIFTPDNIDEVEEKEYIETLRSGNLIEKVGVGIGEDK